jgi:hypothetical protein
MLRVFRVIVLVAIALGTSTVVQAGVTPADACKDSKAKETGRYALSLTRAFGRNGKVPNLARLASDLSKAQSKMTTGFTRAEFSGSGAPRGCVTTGDVITIQAKADSLAEDVIDEIAGVVSTSTTTTPTTSSTTAPTSTSTTMPETCTSGPYPTCGGSCPPGQVCQSVTLISNAIAPHCACFPSSLPCPDSCGQPPGACPPGQLCVVNDTPVGDCGCVAPPWCIGTVWPTCGGNCPDGLCIAAPGGVCYCVGD